MTSIAPQAASYDDLLRLPDTVVGEIIDGELIASPRPAAPHASAASVLGMDLGSPFQRGRGGPGGWWIIDQPELHLKNDVLVPDLAGWRRERLPEVPDAPAFTLAPDWVCEVLSPSTERLDRLRKMRIYARESIKHVWLVNPRVRLLEVYRLEGEHWVRVSTFEADERVRAEPFEAVELELGALWTTNATE